MNDFKGSRSEEKFQVKVVYSFPEMIENCGKKYREEGRYEGIKEGRVEDIKCLMRNLSITEEHARELLEIPMEEEMKFYSFDDYLIK